MKILLNAILLEMDTFLVKWTDYMEQAGYLEHTTAKKEDCILSLRYFSRQSFKTTER